MHIQQPQVIDYRDDEATQNEIASDVRKTVILLATYAYYGFNYGRKRDYIITVDKYFITGISSLRVNTSFYLGSFFKREHIER